MVRVAGSGASEAGRQSDPLEAAIDALEVGLLVVDAAGELLIINAAAADLLGDWLSWLLGRDRLRGWRITAIDGETVVRPSELPLGQALRGHGPSSTEIMVDRRRERPVYLSLSARPLPAPQAGAVLTIVESTDQRRRDDEAREAEERFRLTFEGAPVGMALVETGERWGSLIQVNAALGVLAGREANELLALRIDELVSGHEDGQALRRLFSAEASSAMEQMRFRRPDGTSVWVQVTASIVQGVAGGPRYAILQVEDIQVRRRYEERLRYLADHDPLTGLLNRRRFEEAIAAHRDQCERYGADGAIVLVDLDGFKDVNDTMGHAAGDAVLRTTSEQLADRVRATDVLARLGGDEFAVLLTKTDAEEAVAVARDLVGRIAGMAQPGGWEDRRGVTATAGVAMFAGDALAMRDVLAEADVALYEAKDGSRGGVALYHP